MTLYVAFGGVIGMPYDDGDEMWLSTRVRATSLPLSLCHEALATSAGLLDVGIVEHELR